MARSWPTSYKKAVPRRKKKNKNKSSSMASHAATMGNLTFKSAAKT